MNTRIDTYLEGFVRRGIVLAAVATLTVSGIAACGAGGGTADKNTPPAKAGVNSIAVTPRDRVKQGGQFVWPASEIPPNFNYAELDGTEADTANVMNALMPQFFMIDAAGNAIWDKDYLTEAPQIKTDPKQVITFELNPKATWYDGSPITWEDLEWQWKASNGTNQAYKISSSNGWKDIES